MTVFVFADENGIPFNECVYAAYEGFRERGAEVCLFQRAEMESGTLPLSRETPVVGTIPAVRRAWRQIGVAPPPLLDYPDVLAPFMERRIERIPLGTLARRLAEEEFARPVFVKPANVQKGFTGFVWRSMSQAVEVAHLPDDFEVFVSDAVTFVSEYRIFVLHGEILDVRHYKGSPFRALDEATVNAALIAYSSAEEMPAAYALDFGVLEDGRTALVEVNDSYALGTYGLRPTLYARMIESRWAEVCGSSAGTAFPSGSPIIEGRGA